MFQNITLAIDQLNGQLVALSAVVFLLGVALTDAVIEQNIGWLLKYPTWMSKKLEGLLDRFNGMVFLFSFIFIFNSFNMFIGFTSGFLIVLPFILALWTGLNIGIILRNSIQEGNILLLMLNPVALIELPAGWISFSLGIEMGMQYFITREYGTLPVLFKDRLLVFLWVVLPLLAISGLLEAAMIRFISKSDQPGSGDDSDPGSVD